MGLPSENNTALLAEDAVHISVSSPWCLKKTKNETLLELTFKAFWWTAAEWIITVDQPVRVDKYFQVLMLDIHCMNWSSRSHSLPNQGHVIQLRYATDIEVYPNLLQRNCRWRWCHQKAFVPIVTGSEKKYITLPVKLSRLRSKHAEFLVPMRIAKSSFPYKVEALFRV